MVAAVVTSANLVHVLVDDRLQCLGDLLLVACHHLGDIELAGSHLLSDLLWLQASLNHSVGDEEKDTFIQHAFLFQSVNHHVRQRHLVLIHAVDAHQTAQSTLHSDGGVLFNEFLHLVGNLLCQTSCILNFSKIKS